MDGYNVFQFTVKTIPAEIGKLACKSDTSMDEIDMFVFHQASRKVLETLGKKLKIPENKLLIDLHDVGNTTSSTIPIALKRAEERQDQTGRQNNALRFRYRTQLVRNSYNLLISSRKAEPDKSPQHLVLGAFVCIG